MFITIYGSLRKDTPVLTCLCRFTLSTFVTPSLSFPILTRYFRSRGLDLIKEDCRSTPYDYYPSNKLFVNNAGIYKHINLSLSHNRIPYIMSLVVGETLDIRCTCLGSFDVRVLLLSLLQTFPFPLFFSLSPMTVYLVFHGRVTSRCLNSIQFVLVQCIILFFF